MEVTMEVTMEDLDYLRTLMILHNGHAPWDYQNNGIWYVRPPPPKGEGWQPIRHEVELANTIDTGYFYWTSERDAIIAYCKYYKLGGYSDGR
jgi:hypothetical protein